MIAIDPGLRGCGVAVFDVQRNLAWASWVRNPILTGRGPDVWWHMADAIAAATAQMPWSTTQGLCLEMPKVYPGMPKTDLNDLLDLAGVLGAVVMHSALGHGPEPKWCYPQDWKGQTPKKVMNERVLLKLSEAEKARIVDAGSKTHNILDAIGIGLHFLGRLERVRKYGE